MIPGGWLAGKIFKQFNGPLAAKELTKFREKDWDFSNEQNFICMYF